MGTTEQLARWVVGTSYQDFPDDVVAIAKERVLDTLGVMLAGSREPVARAVVRYVKDSGGVAEAGVLGCGFRTSVTNAVLVNGTLAHAVELEPAAKYHGGVASSVVPVAFGVAEKFHLSGKSVLEGVIIGTEVHGRIGRVAAEACNRGFVGLGIFGPLALAAEASRMMNLSVAQTMVAISIGASQSSGLVRQTGSMCHLFEQGLPCRNGVTAALLAREGMTAEPEIIEEQGGFCDLFCPSGDYDLTMITKDLGKPFYILSPGVSVKKYGCCFYEHRAMEALFQLIAEHELREADVDEVSVSMLPYTRRTFRYPDPANGEQAKFSLEHALGAVLVDRKPTLPYLYPFSEAGFRDPRYRAATKKVRVIINDGAAEEVHTKPSPVTVRMKDGRSFAKSVTILKGSPELPLSPAEMIERYKNCVSGVVSSERVERTIELVMNLEELSDISELMELATFGYRQDLTDAARMAAKETAYS